MAETTEATPVVDARRIVVEFAERNGAVIFQRVQTDHNNRRATRMLFIHPMRYCQTATLSEDCTKAASMLDISLAGVGFRCYSPLTVGAVIHVHLPLLDGNSAWVKGSVIYHHSEIGCYRVGVAFIFEQEQI